MQRVAPVEPRIFTPPLRDLSEPGATDGPLIARFAEELYGTPLLPWQRWFCDHAFERLEDGRLRFREILLSVGRQAGKSLLARILLAYWATVDEWPISILTSTQQKMAVRDIGKLAKDIEKAPLGPELCKYRTANGSEGLLWANSCETLVAAVGRKGGRGESADRIFVDELREHLHDEGMRALRPTMKARPHALMLAASSMGDLRSTVMNNMRDALIEAIETGDTKSRRALFEWSAEPGCAADDPEGIMAANPAVGYTMDLDELISDARAAMREGGPALAAWRTEGLNQLVPCRNSAIDGPQWLALYDPAPIPDSLKRQVCMCVDVAPDGMSASLVAAVRMNDRIRVELVQAWEGLGAGRRMAQDLPAIIKRAQPRYVGWFPAGPANSVMTEMTKQHFMATRVEPLGNADSASVCMELRDSVQVQEVVHSSPGDALLSVQVMSAEAVKAGNGRFAFGRTGGGYVDAAYALAGAVHLVRAMPRMFTGGKEVKAS